MTIESFRAAFSAAPWRCWLILRITSFVVAGLALGFENKHLKQSLHQLLLRPWSSYDTYYYVRIVSEGYQSSGITSGFHPLFPLLAEPFYFLTGEPILSLMIVSSVAGLLLTIFFFRLAAMSLPRDRAYMATSLFLCWPVSLAIFAPYTESLFLLLGVLCLLAARKERFWLAGVAGALASLTRQQGIFLLLPLMWEVWEASNRKWANVVNRWDRVVALFLIPFGYGAWIFYRAVAINDLSPDFSSPEKFIFSVMISPSHYHVFARQQFLPPWIAVYKAIKILWHGGIHWSAYGDALLGTLFIAMFGFSWRSLRTSDLIYSLSIILVALSYHTGQSINPYTALPRHMLLAFPVFVAFAERYRFQRPKFVLITLAICQQLFLCCFVWQTWVL